jgi:hypothetical protein
MLKISIKYGFICSVFLIIIFHVSDYFGINPLMNVVHLIFDLMIFGIFIFFGTKELKMSQEDEILHFWQGMTMGFNTYFVATTVFSLYLIIYFQWSDSAVMDYQESATNFLLEKRDLYEDKLGKETFQAQLDAIRSVTWSDLVLSAALKKILAGFFITPVISIILRKQLK